jgi:hypothetical protein
MIFITTKTVKGTKGALVKGINKGHFWCNHGF